MQAWATQWVNRQILDYEAAPGSSPWRFAWLNAIRVALIAEAGMIGVHTLLHLLGLHGGRPLGEALVTGTLVAVPVSALVTAVISVAVHRALQALAVSRDEFERLSATDLLSGLENRRAFFRRLEDARDDAILAIFDIDRFKHINDTYGHLAGDEVIRGVARILSSVFGKADGAVGRLGGEEFAVLLRQIDEGNVRLVDEARAAVSLASIEVDQTVIGVTVSAGVAELRAGRETLEVYRLADQALYFAKAAGRNRVVHERDVVSVASAAAPAPAKTAAAG